MEFKWNVFGSQPSPFHPTGLEVNHVCKECFQNYRIIHDVSSARNRTSSYRRRYSCVEGFEGSGTEGKSSNVDEEIGFGRKTPPPNAKPTPVKRREPKREPTPPEEPEDRRRRGRRRSRSRSGSKSGGGRERRRYTDDQLFDDSPYYYDLYDYPDYWFHARPPMMGQPHHEPEPEENVVIVKPKPQESTVQKPPAGGNIILLVIMAFVLGTIITRSR
jgi:hypothetical protein